MINTFLTAFTENKLSTITDILDDDILFCSSILPEIHGCKKLIKQLSWNQKFDVMHVTVTNRMSDLSPDSYQEALTAHHLVSYEQYNQMYPLVFGGKYLFEINPDTQKITKVSFVLEYQAENTIYLKDLWNLSNGFNDYSILNDFHFDQIYANALKHRNIQDLISLLFWALDTSDIHHLNTLCDDKFQIARDQSVGHSRFTSTLSDLDQYIQETLQYYAMDQHSIRVNSISENDGVITVYAQHLTPHRLGTKKLNSATKYHSFFDEDITVTLNSSDLKFLSIDMKKAADVFYNGFEILEY